MQQVIQFVFKAVIARIKTFFENQKEKINSNLFMCKTGSVHSNLNQMSVMKIYRKKIKCFEDSQESPTSCYGINLMTGCDDSHWHH